MSHGDYSYYRVMEWLPTPLPGLILDAGCGCGEAGLYLRTFPDRPFSRLCHRPKLIGYDVDRESIDRLRPLGLYDQLIHDDLMNLEEHLSHVPMSICLETLEHLKKPEALHVLGALSRISERLLVIVPYGITLNESDLEPMKHRSAWWPQDFKRLGLEVHVDDAVAPLLPRPVRLIYRAYMTARGGVGWGDGRRIVALNYDPREW